VSANTVARLKDTVLDWRYRVEYVALRIIIAAVRAMPLDRAVRVSAWCWKTIAPLLRRHTRALNNLTIAFPEKTAAERDVIARAMWANLGRVMAETMQLDRIIADPSRIEITSQRIFQRYKGRLGPAVGVSLHMGNWELAIWPLTSAGAEPAAVYRSVNNPYVDRYLRDQRKVLYPGGLLAKGREEDSKKTVRIITDYVRKGGRLGIVSDLHDNQGIPVPFFGTPAKSVAAPALIARRLGVRIWMARCIRVGTESRFRIEMKELKVTRTTNQGEDIRTITAAMQAQFEEWIRETPEQWMWSNRRWS
jgi:Kdo2-lipid IVA lauroyltransferase/acyltransferase